uniref:Uncharacterized protein n=1 Tax=Geoglobus ahangari TaxID=113653 RepID=A0A7J3TK11_9EURY
MQLHSWSLPYLWWWNRIAINHAVWFAGVLFTAFTLQLGHLTLSAGLGLLVLVCFGLSVANYTGKDAWIFLAMAYANATGTIVLPFITRRSMKGCYLIHE